MPKTLLHKIIAIFILILIVSPIYAQDTDPDIDDWDDFRIDPYVKGDQFIVINAGTVFPTVFLKEGKSINMNFKYPLGGCGSLSYNYFLTGNIFTGGEVGVQFLSSINSDSAFFIPLVAKIGYQFLIWKLEIPVSLSAGVYWARFQNYGYFGFHAKGGLSVYYRAINDWSFGLTSNWFWYPQWTYDRTKNVYGNMLDLTLSARYHF